MTPHAHEPDDLPKPGPLLAHCREKLEQFPFAVNGLLMSIRQFGLPFLDLAETHLHTLFTLRREQWEGFDRDIDAFLEMTVDSLRMQREFSKSGKVARFSREERHAEIYEHPERMMGPYLTGLYLAHILWPNHYRKLRFLEERFLPRLVHKHTLLDVGCGPGVYSSHCLAAHPALHALALDISPYSGQMAEGLLRATEPALLSRWQFETGDFLTWSGACSCDAALFSEVVEHLDDPEAGLRRLTELLPPASPIFFTTATNAAFYDHTVVFASVEEIRILLRDHGLDILDEEEIPAFQSRMEPQVVDYCAVITPRGGGSHVRP